MGSPSDIDLSLANIWKSWYNFRKGKRNSQAILEFEWGLEGNLANLHQDLVDSSYQHGSYDHFIVNEHKRRDIAVASVRDRVVHRLLYDYLVPLCDKRFDYDVWSCRVGKGNTAALERTAQLLRKHPNSYVWRGDVAKFFDNIDHHKILEILRRYNIGDKAYEIVDKVINSYPLQLEVSQSVSQSVIGLPIGNLTSQVLANIYLHEFDHFVRHNLKPPAYMRYGDDFLLIGTSIQQVRQFQKIGTEFLKQKLQLPLHSKNNLTLPVKRGIHYLGVVHYPNSRTLSPAMFQYIQDKTSLKNQDSYINYVNQYGNRKQKILIELPV